jgi:hypothetical protein
MTCVLKSVAMEEGCGHNKLITSTLSNRYHFHY